MAPVSPAAAQAATSARARRPLVAHTALGLALAAIALAACYDRPTAPPAIAPVPVPRHDFTADPGWGANNSAAAGSWDGTIEEVRGSAPASATPLGPFVYPTFVRVRVTGEVRQLPGALPGSNIVRQPYNASDPEFWGVIGLFSGGDTWWATSSEAILRVVRPITPFRNVAGNQPRGDATHCGYPGYALCWSWAGSAHFDFVRLPVALTLARSPDTTVWVGTAATFTAGVSQTFFPPNPHPVGLMELRWRWLPDSGGSSADSVACDGILGPTCTRVFRGSGTMYASAYVNGEHQQKSMHVDVRVPKIVLNASKTTLVAGDSATFTATKDGGTTLVVQGWAFRPDSGGGLSGATVGSSWGACLSTRTQCTMVVPASGTVYVTGKVDGVGSSDSVHVTVTPPELSLTASATEVAEGDAVTFTGLVTPQSSNYQVIGWSWVSDGAAPILASSSPVNSPTLSPSTARSARRTAAPRASGQLTPQAPTRDLSEPTDPVELVSGDSVNMVMDVEISDADPRSEPVACASATLVCRMAITKPGTVTLAVRLGETVEYRSAHVSLDYVCPENFPTALVPDVGEKAVPQAKGTVIRWMAGIPVLKPIGNHSVWVSGPWVLLEPAGFEQSGVPKGHYRPGSARNDLGNDKFLPTSWVEFRCLTRIKDVDNSGNLVFSGTMLFNHSINITWKVP